MAFPQTPLDIKAELRIDGTWTDVTADVYTRDIMTITRGQPDEGSRSDPGKCTLTFNNGASKAAPGISGRYSEGNPLSDLYGKIGRNTLVRVHVPKSTAHLELDGDTTGYVSTPHAAALNITGDIDVRVEFDADMTDTARNQNLIGKWSTTNTERAWSIRWYVGRLVFGWRDASAASVEASISAALYGGAALRVTLDVDDGAGGLAVRFYQADSISGPWTQIGNTVTGGFTTAIQSTTTSDLRIGPTDATTTPPRVPFIGTATRAQVRSGIDGTLVADLDTRALADGATGTTDSTGRVWTVNGTAKVRKRADRFVGEISSWPPRWDVSGKDRWVPVEAAGILRRYGRPNSPLGSTLRRRIPSGTPDAYWPMEEGSGATQAYSPMASVRAAAVSGMSFAGIDTLPGSSALPTLGAAATLQATVPAGSATGWHAEFVYFLETLPSTQQQIARVKVSGAGMAAAVVLAGTAGIRVEVRDADENVTAFFNFNDADALAAFTGTWNRLQIYTSVNGADTYVHAGWRKVVENEYWVVRTIYTGVPGRAVQVIGSWGSAYQGMGVGHLAVWNGVAASLTTPYRSSVTTYESADDGFQREYAGERVYRLGSEENLPFSIRGVVTDQQRLGAQRPGPLLNLLEDAAASDIGILMEHRTRPALRLRGRATLYSQTPALTLNYAANREVAPPLEPATDDAEITNDVTVERADGSSGRAVLSTGTLSVQNPPSGVGLYESSVTRSLGDDSQAQPLAEWLLHLGTMGGWPTPRYPVVHVDLAAAPHLIDAVLAVDQGDMLRITNPPRDVPPGNIDLIVRGYSESFDQYAWDVYFNCVPAVPWRVAAAALVEDFEDTTYVVTAANGGAVPWARSQLHFNTGAWSLRSGAITNNQTSDWIVNVPPGATEMRFWYWTSSEAAGSGFLGDRLIVLADATTVLTAQGTTGWTQFITDVTGKTTITFRYAKDNSASSGEDAVHIDDLSFEGESPVRVDTDGSQLAAGATSTATSLSVAVTAGNLWATSAAYPTEFPFNVLIGGEEMRVDAITGASSPQTWTVVRSVNGIVKAQTANTVVRLAENPIGAL
ncbi:hypothetical protein [Streptomyces sp. YKOK-I1]